MDKKGTILKPPGELLDHYVGIRQVGDPSCTDLVRRHGPDLVVSVGVCGI